MLAFVVLVLSLGVRVDGRQLGVCRPKLLGALSLVAVKGLGFRMGLGCWI